MQIQHVDPKLLVEDATNPRGKIVIDDQVKELADSLKTVGMLYPIVVVKGLKGRFRVVSGHRRLAAAQHAGLEAVPIIVREMTDEQLKQEQITENLHRQDLHPMEEAFAIAMLEEQGRSMTEIAQALSKTQSWVYDRIRLLKLIKPLRDRFLKDEFTLGHAIVLSRLKDTDQRKALDEALFEPERVVGRYMQSLAGDDREEWVKPRSVAELQDWVDRNIRFDLKGDTVTQLFPETKDAVVAAETSKTKTIWITHEYQLPPNARSQERTFTQRSWKLADPAKQAKPCEHSVLGIVAAGQGRGQAFLVCTRRDKCKIHWGQELREKAKMEKRSGHTKDTKEKMKEQLDRQREAYEKEEKRREAFRERYKKALPEIRERVYARIKQGLTDTQIRKILTPRDRVKLHKGETFDGVVQELLFQTVLAATGDSWFGWQNGPKYLKDTMGLDVTGLLRPEKEGAPAQPKKRPAKKK